ncbi:uncharacterized protein si:ch211-132g1.3 [Austrofundulus limnaeus]|uniref:Uncharacterized protein si:ch211-132g1.3 n=1 Tax=Austrofundulus limnaeus TaxID=52670 RepID=A0A2I4D1Z3_AUSLI|nr:PREDICTED: uncharacterized protein LOC106534236 [Austrofundulus limnaeus]
MLASVSLFFLVLCNLAHDLSAQMILSPKNAVVKGEVVLVPAHVSAKIIDVTWKHNSDIALEWGGINVKSFREFENRTTLDTTNGALTIRNLTRELNGTYTAEINNLIVSSQQVKIFDPVPKPTLTRTDGETENSHVFTCDYKAPENAQPVELKWRIDDVEQPGPKVRIVQGNKNCSFVCELINPVSKQSSEAVGNPSCNNGLGPGPIIGIFGIVLIPVLLFVLFYVIFVRKPPVFKDNPIIKALRNSAFGKLVDRNISTSKGNQDGAGAQEDERMMNDRPSDKSAEHGANGTSDSKQEDKAARAAD